MDRHAERVLRILMNCTILLTIVSFSYCKEQNKITEKTQDKGKRKHKRKMKQTAQYGI